MTGHDLKLTTPNDVLTARDDLEYWSQQHMAVARGDAVVVTNDGRRIAADTLVAYTAAAGGAGRASDPGRGEARHQQRRIRWPPRASWRRSRRSAMSSVRTVDRHRDRRPRGLCAGHRHGPAGRAMCGSRAARTSSTGPRRSSNMKTGIARLLAGNTGARAGPGGAERRDQQVAGRAAGRAAPAKPEAEAMSGRVPGRSRAAGAAGAAAAPAA